MPRQLLLFSRLCARGDATRKARRVHASARAPRSVEPAALAAPRTTSAKVLSLNFSWPHGRTCAAFSSAALAFITERFLLNCILERGAATKQVRKPVTEDGGRLGLPAVPDGFRPDACVAYIVRALFLACDTVQGPLSEAPPRCLHLTCARAWHRARPLPPRQAATQGRRRAAAVQQQKRPPQRPPRAAGNAAHRPARRHHPRRGRGVA